MTTTFYWNPNHVSSEINVALQLISEHYPLREGGGSPQLVFEGGLTAGENKISRNGANIHISYGRLSDALRGLGAALAGLPAEGQILSEKCTLSSLGIMLDCSRNSVMSVETFQRWLRNLALLGYNMAMLYTEDTYQLPDEPFFGLFRGAYSPVELKQIDDYAARLGIEMIGCIQTLGHLEQMLKWYHYSRVSDTDRELLVGEQATYDLIRKMIAAYAECFHSRRIHIGMDETWTLGRGRFLDRNGQRSGYDILTQHLDEVTAICSEAGLKPMIWSDMFFKFGGDMHASYDVNSVIPEEVKQAIPPDLDLVYWEYCADTEEQYLKLIDRHRQLGSDPVVASGVWTWLRLWYGRFETEAAVTACSHACRTTGIRDLFFTMWGDDGGYCEFNSALAGLAFAAAQCYLEDPDNLKRRFEAVVGLPYDAILLGSELEFIPSGLRNGWSPDASAATTLWDDPLLGMKWLGCGARYPGFWDKAIEHYRSLSAKLARYEKTTQPIDLGHAAALARFLAAKLDFRRRLESAYPNRNASELQRLADEIPGILTLLDELEHTFRRQWTARNKSFGLETIQIRLGGLRLRFIETSRCLDELLAGKRDSIPQLEEGLTLPEEVKEAIDPGNYYRRFATSGIL